MLDHGIIPYDLSNAPKARLPHATGGAVKVSAELRNHSDIAG